MSRLFGDIRQIGMIVRDAEAAMKKWGELGVGPFFTMNLKFDDFMYRGQPSPAPEVTLCFAHSGPVQIELIQQHNDVPSAYRDFLENGREGVQHISAWFGDHASYDAKRQALIDSGLELIQEGGSRASDARFAYFATQEPGGLMIEISEALIGDGAAGCQMMDQAARQWDGLDLIAARY